MSFLTFAAHQPNFLPWLGYFDKQVRADIFVVLDDVLLQKTGSTWVNRVQMWIGGSAKWLTVPLVRESGYFAISQIRIDDSQNWRKKTLRTLELNYGKTPYYSELHPVIIEILECPEESIARFNIHAIRRINSLLGLDNGKLRLSSTLSAREKSTNRLVELAQKLGATTYLCGGGAEGYQEDEKFASANVTLEYQNFKHPQYLQSQSANFKPGLSIIDALFNCGASGVRKMLGVQGQPTA